MIETVALIAAALLAVVAVVGLIDVLRRLGGRRRLQEELARLEEEGTSRERARTDHDEEER